MNFVEKYQSVFILISVSIGLILGQNTLARNYASLFIVPFLMVMLFGIFLQVPLGQLKNSFKNWKFAGVSASINFIFNPTLAFFLGFLFLSDTPALWIGFIMLMVTPCTDWYLLFTGIARGNVPLSASILPMNLILQLLLLPIYLLLFAGNIATINPTLLMESVVLVLLIPFIASLVSKTVVPGIKGEYWLQEKIFPNLDHVQFLFLNLAIISMFASQGEQLVQNPLILLKLITPVLLFFVIVFVVGQIVGRYLGFSYQDTASLNLTTLARNSPIVLAIALTAFPEEPLIALALVIGPLIELPVLGIISHTLLWIRKSVS
ncbi:arsenic resistance protein [Methanohalophilus halophilus]|uniref:Arsenic resistance protein n=1 Tax=Methanohalophilus halophilus TaxID=2177 RepID=A0A1L3Q0V5_9EURY|nr:bile acid:sodium symporter [Methanohalophilus halophilus]APH38502.1 arsenic resistance protein [Methanohalophilus halophilus]RNI10620.1 arsenic resistance protein [Methanohalophilus halophilus]SDW11212.1 Arsenite efflux pump ArsB, ACR3 family [Methanohalophilus halophilus]